MSIEIFDSGCEFLGEIELSSSIVSSKYSQKDISLNSVKHDRISQSCNSHINIFFFITNFFFRKLNTKCWAVNFFLLKTETSINENRNYTHVLTATWPNKGFVKDRVNNNITAFQIEVEHEKKRRSAVHVTWASTPSRSDINLFPSIITSWSLTWRAID